jgi:hypothetical protein
MMVEARGAASSIPIGRRPDLGSTLIAGCFLLLAAAVAIGKVGKPTEIVAFVLVLTSLLVVWHRVLLGWESLVCVIIAIVLFVPIGRFSLPARLPFDLELYRVAVAAVLACWILSLLVDPRVQFRRGPLDLPIAIIVVSIVGSIVLNVSRVVPLEAAVLKATTFSLSYILTYCFVVSVVKTPAAIMNITKFLVGGTSVVAFFAAVEQRTHFNVFDHVGTILPFLKFLPYTREAERFGVWRALGPAQHPIALGVLFVMVLPLAFALTRAASRRWWAGTFMIFIGVIATVSRTPVLSLLVAGLILVWLRPRDIVRVLPLVVPLVLVIKIAMPGSIATVKNSFFPSGGLVKQQTQLALNADPLLAGGRLRQLKPMIAEGSRTPVFGQGVGTRQTGFGNPLRNAPILDNQWLSLFLDIGAIGVFGWALLIVLAVRKLVATSRSRDGPEAWLAVGYAASITGFAIGMFTYDSLSFTQGAFVVWIILGLATALLLVPKPGLSHKWPDPSNAPQRLEVVPAIPESGRLSALSDR